MSSTYGTVVARKLVVDEALNHPQISSGTGPPSGVPRAIGDTYVDTDTGNEWVAAWSPVTSSNVWTLANVDAYRWRNVSDPSTTATISDGTIGMSNTGNKDVYLPKISELGQMMNQKRFTVVDTSGTADTNRLAIFAASGDTILGTSNFTLIDNYASVQLFCVEDTQWFVGCAS